MGWLAAQELDASDGEKLFTLLDKGNGHLSALDLVQGVSHLKGASRSIDLAALTRKHDLVQAQVARMDGLLASIHQRLCREQTLPSLVVENTSASTEVNLDEIDFFAAAI